MSTWRTPRCASASTTALCTAGPAPMVPDSPIPLAPSGLRGVGVTVWAVSKLGSSAALGIEYVGEVGGQRVAVLIEDDLLVERLCDALRHAAVHAGPSTIMRVEDPTAVVDGHVAERPRIARVSGRPPRPRRGRRRGTWSRRPRSRSRRRDRAPCRRAAASDRRQRARARPIRARESGAPATPIRPSPNETTSSTLDLEEMRREAPRLLPHELARAQCTALPPTWSEREPIVPSPRGRMPVSDCSHA